VVQTIMMITDPARRPTFKLQCPAPIIAMRALLAATPQARP